MTQGIDDLMRRSKHELAESLLGLVVQSSVLERQSKDMIALLREWRHAYTVDGSAFAPEWAAKYDRRVALMLSCFWYEEADRALEQKPKSEKEERREDGAGNTALAATATEE